MRQFLQWLRLVKLVYLSNDGALKLRVVWYGKGTRFVKKCMGGESYWLELMPNGNLKYPNGSHSEWKWKDYEPIHLSPFSFLGKNKAIEVKLRLE